MYSTKVGLLIVFINAQLEIISRPTLFVLWVFITPLFVGIITQITLRYECFIIVLNIMVSVKTAIIIIVKVVKTKVSIILGTIFMKTAIVSSINSANSIIQKDGVE